MDKKSILIIGVVLVLVATAVFVLLSAPKKKAGEPTYSIATAERTNLVKILTARGKVAPPQDIDLYLLRTGVVEKINVGSGSIINTGDEILNLDNKQLLLLKNLTEQDIEIESTELKRLEEILTDELQWLADLTSGYSEEAFARQQQKISNSKREIEDAKTNLVKKIQGTLTRTQKALKHIDLLFDEPDTSPQLKFTTADPGLTGKAVFGRATMNLFLASWKGRLENLTAGSDLNQYYNEAGQNLGKTTDFINDISLAVLDIDDPGVSDFLAAVYKLTVANTEKEIDLAAADLDNAKQRLEDSIISLARAEAGLQTLLTGPTPSKINAQQTVVDAAEAEKDKQEARLGKVLENLAEVEEEIAATILSSSIEGKITKLHVAVGDSIGAYQLLVSMVSDDKVEFEIELSFDEMAEVKVGNEAKIKIDEFTETLLGEVYHLDREESKALLKFDAVPSNVEVDMEGEVSIVTQRRENVIAIPSQAIIKKDYYNVVLVSVLGTKPQERRVKTGLYDSFGNVEILDGLNEGEKVLISE